MTSNAWLRASAVAAITVLLTACTAPAGPGPAPSSSLPAPMVTPTRNPSGDAAALAQYDDLAADVRRSVDAEFGALTWTTPSQPRHHRDDVTQQCYLLSSTSWGLQLPGAETDQGRVRRVTDAAMSRHGFPATHELAGSGAQYRLESSAGDSVRFEVMARSQYAFWIEIPLPEDQCA